MADEPSPAQIKFFRRLVRRSPELSFEEAMDRWRAEHGEVQPADAEVMRTLYDEEQAARAHGPPPHDPNHSRTVMRTIVAWIGVHVLLLVAVGLSAYTQCTGQPATGGIFGGCGLNVGLTALAIGVAQLVYGVIAAAVLAMNRRTAIAQGLFISAATVVVLFTAVCFGATFAVQ
jgi:hypothetical protein